MNCSNEFMVTLRWNNHRHHVSFKHEKVVLISKSGTVSFIREKIIEGKIESHAVPGYGISSI